MATITQYLGTGRRKKSIARVRLLPGTGKITVNKRDVDDYFGYETLKMIVRAPMVLTDTLSKFDKVAEAFQRARGGATSDRRTSDTMRAVIASHGARGAAQ